MALAPIQVNYLTCDQLGEGDYTSSGNKITFTMPKKDVLIQADVTGVIGNVDLSLNVPATGATSIVDPVIDSKNNYELNYVELIDADNNEVNEENPIVKGMKYIAIIALKAKDNYAFAYKGDLFMAMAGMVKKDQ